MTALYAQQYLFIGMLAIAAAVFAVIPLVFSRWVAPQRPGKDKNSAYECGIAGRTEAWVGFRAHYYIYALLFVIFDIEVIFLFPWALVWKTLGIVAFIEMALFLFILFIGLVYAWRKGVLEWY